MAGNGRVRITKEIHEERIRNKLILLPTLVYIDIIDYVDGKSKIHFNCSVCNSESKTCSIDNFYKRVRCPECSNLNKNQRHLIPLSQYENEIMRSESVTNGLYLYNGIEFFKTKKYSRINLTCIKHDIPFSMSIDNFVRGKGCSKCGIERSSLSKVKSRQQHIDGFEQLHANKYLYDNFIWNGVHSPCTFICKLHNYEFEKTPANFRRKVEHCPLCNGNVDINTLPTQLYVQSIVKDGLKFGKFGISLDTNRRMIQQQWKSGAEHQVLTIITFNTRTSAIQLEKILKESIPHGVVDYSVLPDGHTETFDAQYLHIVLEIVNSFNSQEED